MVLHDTKSYSAVLTDLVRRALPVFGAEDPDVAHRSPKVGAPERDDAVEVWTRREFAPHELVPRARHDRRQGRRRSPSC